ncbi:MAG: hypothetical protein OHK0012_21790 [Synechococcales cyanobacterium]
MFKNLTDLAQKTLDLSIGLVSLVADKAAEQLGRLQQQSQGLRSQLVEELVRRGQMNREQAVAYVTTLLNQTGKSAEAAPASSSSQPRSIRIDDDEGDTTANAIELTEAAELRQQIQRMQAELERLKKQSP